MVIAVVFVFVAVVPHSRSVGPTVQLAAPDTWQKETIPFPLEFAPSNDYRGSATIRFTPYFFDQQSEEFWSYTFVWCVEGNQRISATRLNADLKTYFEGLSRSVEKAERYDETKTAIRAELTPIESANRHQAFAGTISSYDPFQTHDRITLNARVQIFQRTSDGEETVLLFEISPQPYAHPVWKSLQEVADGFRCPSAGPSL